MRVHLIAIGGAVMHNLALALLANGHQVSGSDDEIYNPARERLAVKGLLPAQEGWHPERITTDLDIVILGMHARKDNPELLHAQALGLRVMSYPEFIYEHAKNKKRFVVAGSHGKTTTVAMAMHSLRLQNIDFDYLVGAQVEGFDTMVRLSDAPYMILEGDEYLSSAIDLTPKMVQYHAHSVVVTGIAWDHINVFPTYDSYKVQFSKLIASLEPGANLIWYEKDSELQQLVENHKANATFYSLPYAPFPAVIEEGQMVIKIWGKPRIAMQAFGEHNLANAKGASLLCNEMGVSTDDFLQDLASFKGAARRLQPLHEKIYAAAWQDFAHAPSKLEATIQAVKTRYPHRKLVACYELHTFSSLNKDFLPQYNGKMNLAEQAFVFYSPHTMEMKKMPPLSPEEVQAAFGHPNLKVFTDRNALELALEDIGFANKNLLFMSSGTFGGMNLKEVAERVL